MSHGRFLRARRIWGALALAALAMAAGPLRAQDGQRPPVGTPWNARVLYVVDGDSLWVRPEGGGVRARLRLEGIDAPEICQDQGPEARAALQALALGRRVRVTVRTYDRYGRAIASVVRLDGEVDLAGRMVAGGQAWNETFRWYLGLYPQEQEAARMARLGLFAARDPEPPADFRRRHGSCARPAR
ncbi:MAG: thermonuclease family protein [Burkholderiaceae bacterium]|nr:thermonuclease family protein [Ottowia sp.]